MGLELVLAAITVILGLTLGRRVLTGSADMSLHDICILVSGLFFGVGVFVAWINSPEEIPGMPGATAIATYFAIWTFQIGLSLTASMTRTWERRSQEKPLTMVRIARMACLSRSMRGLAILLVLWVAIYGFRLWCGLEFGFWASGSATQEVMFSLGYPLFIAITIAEFLDRALVFWASVRLWIGGSLRERLLAIGIIGGALFYHFSKGRRELLGLLAVMALGYVVAFRKITVTIGVVAAAVGLVLYTFVFPVFLVARQQYTQETHREKSDNALSPWLRAVGGAVGEDKEYRKDLFQANLSIRPLIHRFIGEIFDSQQRAPLLYGRAMRSTLVMNIPTVLWPSKRYVLPTEALIVLHYQMPEIDSALTPVAMGVADFGLLGGLLAGLGLGAYFSMIQWIASRHAWRYPMLSLGILGMVFAIVLRFEEEPTAFVSILRTYLILLVPVWFWRHLRPFRVPLVPVPARPVPAPCPPPS